MPVKPITTRREIEDYIERQVRRTERVLINTLAYVGEACVRTARIGGSYKDQTGNLRSSVGYVIVKDGRVIRTSSFETEKQGGSGSAEGRKFAEAKAREFPKGITLIVVAGMNYAAYVSATGRDVLDSAELRAGQLVSQLMNQLRSMTGESI
jgi:hypothetical protein